MGGRGFNFFVGCGVVLVVAVTMLQEAAAQTEHVVGNGTGWQQPPNTSFYSDWVSSKTFRVGDKLVFNFLTGSHDVATASKPDFDSCNTGIPDGSIQRTGPVNVTLNATGQHYYYCTFTGHCLAGQKLAINVVGGGAVTPPPPPGTPPATGTSPPPPSATGPSSPPPPPPPSTDVPPPLPSSAPSLAVAGLFVTFLSIVVGLLL